MGWEEAESYLQANCMWEDYWAWDSVEEFQGARAIRASYPEVGVGYFYKKDTEGEWVCIFTPSIFGPNGEHFLVFAAEGGTLGWVEILPPTE
jgi:hypothetical protein